jgi:hypothetical protein
MNVILGLFFFLNGFRFLSFHVQLKIGQKIVYLKIGPKIKLYPAKISLEYFFDKKNQLKLIQFELRIRV